MREYNIMMLRPYVHARGRVHHDPERQSPADPHPRAVSARANRRRKAGVVVLGGVLLAALLAL